jgi:glycosyltransferase involved in cell wall biosynthesis
MRVLMVNPHFPPMNSGSGTVTLELAKGLQARGHVVEVLSVKLTSRDPRPDEVAGIPV